MGGLQLGGHACIELMIYIYIDICGNSVNISHERTL